MSTQKFGIFELKMTGLTRLEAATELSIYFGKDFEQQGGGDEDEYWILDQKGRRWKVGTDESIKPMQKVQGKLVDAEDSQYKVKLVSPALITCDDIGLLQELLGILQKAEAVCEGVVAVAAFLFAGQAD